MFCERFLQNSGLQNRSIGREIQAHAVRMMQSHCIKKGGLVTVATSFGIYFAVSFVTSKNE